MLCFAFLLTAAGSVAIAQTDPHVGTWVLNLEKSKYAPGTAPKSQTSVFAADGKGIKVVTTAVKASGQDNDGIHGDVRRQGSPGQRQSRLGHHRAQARRRAHHRVHPQEGLARWCRRRRSVVAADGKTRTVTVTGVNAQGQKVNTVAFYIRQ